MHPPRTSTTSSHSGPSRVTRKPVSFGDYECYPCNTGQEDTEMETSPIYPVGEMTPNSSGRIEPAPSRPGIPPYQRQVGSERGPEKDPEGASQLDMPLETDTDVKELYRQEWPGLPTQRRDVWRPAVNWLTEPVRRPPKRIGEKLESYSDVCRKRLASRNNSSAVRDRPPPQQLLRLTCLKSDRETRGRSNACYCKRNRKLHVT